MKMTWVILAIIVMAGLGYWNWQKSQGQLKVLKSSGFNVTDDLKGAPRLLVDRINKKIALVSATHYRVIPMAAILSSDALYDRGAHMEKNFRIELQLSSSERSLAPIFYENEPLSRTALDALQGAIH